MALSKVLYSTKVTVTGGRDGEAVSEDGHLKVKLGMPKELGGMGGNVTNPEQLFGAGFAACFLSAMKLVAGKRNIAMDKDPSILADVSLGSLGQGLGLAVTLTVTLPGMDEKQAHELAEEAHKICPYSNATRNNIDVNLVVKTS